MDQNKERADGLREQKKEAARLALHEAALRLMSERGPENVTVEAIADAAFLSKRTFSNYFANKEEAVFYRETLRARNLLDLLGNRPPTEGPLAALRGALDDFAETIDYDAEQLAQRKLLSLRPALAHHRTQAHAEIEREIATQLQHRLPDTPDSPFTADVLAATALAALRVARTHWINDPRVSLRTLLAQALQHLQD